MAHYTLRSFWRLRYGILARLVVWGFVVALGMLPAAQAETMTLRFEAIVSEVTETSPIDFPLEIFSGDTIHGDIKFEPFAAVPGQPITEHLQELPLSFHLNGTLLRTNRYSLAIANDIIVDGPGSPVGPVDGIGAACSLVASGVLCDPEQTEISGSDMFEVTYSINLRGDATVLTEAALTSDVDIWNAFEETRLLTLIFQDSTNGELVVRAVIGDFVGVPEPGVAVHFLAVCLIALLFRVDRIQKGL